MPQFKTQKPPRNWYKYEWPLKQRPTSATYSDNVSPHHRSFSLIFGANLPTDAAYRSNLLMHYVGNSPEGITVPYGGDDKGRPCEGGPQGTPEFPGINPMIKYRLRARRSRILKKFQDNSPAGIRYFQDYDPCSVVLEKAINPCDALPSTIVTPENVTSPNPVDFTTPDFGSFNIDRSFNQSGLNPNYECGITYFDDYTAVANGQQLNFSLAGRKKLNATEGPDFIESEAALGDYPVDFIFDMGEVKLFDGIVIWNQESGTASLSHFQVSLAQNADFSDEIYGGYFIMSPIPQDGGNNKGDVFRFADISARYIKISALRNRGDDVGDPFPSVRFNEFAARVSDSYVPPPIIP